MFVSLRWVGRGKPRRWTTHVVQIMVNHNGHWACCPLQILNLSIKMEVSLKHTLALSLPQKNIRSRESQPGEPTENSSAPWSEIIWLLNRPDYRHPQCSHRQENLHHQEHDHDYLNSTTTRPKIPPLPLKNNHGTNFGSEIIIHLHYLTLQPHQLTSKSYL